MKEFYTVQEVANLTGLGESTIKDKISRQEIKAEKFGRQWMIRAEEINLIKKNQAGRKRKVSC